MRGSGWSRCRTCRSDGCEGSSPVGSGVAVRLVPSPPAGSSDAPGFQGFANRVQFLLVVQVLVPIRGLRLDQVSRLAYGTLTPSISRTFRVLRASSCETPPAPFSTSTLGMSPMMTTGFRSTLSASSSLAIPGAVARARPAASSCFDGPSARGRRCPSCPSCACTCSSPRRRPRRSRPRLHSAAGTPRATAQRFQGLVWARLQSSYSRQLSNVLQKCGLS